MAEPQPGNPSDHRSTGPDPRAVEKARAAALRLLKARDRTRTVLRRRLLAKGHEPAAVGVVLDRLEEVGLLDERASAERAVARELRKGAATARLLQQRLFAEGVGREIASEVIEAALRDVDPVEAAEAEARAWVRKHPGLDRATAARRLMGRLTRRGFDGETVRTVAERVLGEA